MRKTILSLIVLSVLLLGMVSAQAVGLTADTNTLKENIPQSYEMTEKKMAEIMPIPNRFLMWTNDGRHIMWGTFARGYFVGSDNLGKKAWGIYYNGVFAGFYDGAFFQGKYSNGYWKAYDLFGLRLSQGKYITFPTIQPIPVDGVVESN